MADTATRPNRPDDGAALPGPVWPGGVATGVGSMPGTDAREAVAVVAGELPDFPHVPELPARGPGADLVGRTAGLLAQVSADLAVTTTPTGWRFADAPGRDVRRAMSFLHEDLDAVEEGFAGLRGPLKAQLCGPWTLAAAVELRSGERAVRDPGAMRELGEALAEAARAHVADLARRLPGGQIVLSIDEPSLPAVRAGRLPTASGWGRLRAVPDAEVTEALSGVLAAVAAAGALPAVHCCAADAPVGLFVTAGARAVSVDLGVLGPGVQDDVAAAVEAGVGLLAGVVPTDADEAALRSLPVALVVDRLTAWWHRLGFPPETLAQQVSVSPACGLAGTAPTAARAILGRVAAVARAVRDEETPAP